MKITEVTPPVERTFTLELTEQELTTLRVAMGCTSHHERVEHAKVWTSGNILDGKESSALFSELDRALNTTVPGGVE